MQSLILAINLLGTVAFAASGGICAMRKNMDLFGICMLGITTATGGGMLRDLLLGRTPPAIFSTPEYVVLSVLTCLVLASEPVRRRLQGRLRGYDLAMFWMDTLGLGSFTVLGVDTTLAAVENPGLYLVCFMSVITAVGGGVLRDLMANRVPDIFVHHVYAIASLAGALVCCLLRKPLGVRSSLILGAASVVLIRCLAAHYRWNLPKASLPEEK